MKCEGAGGISASFTFSKASAVETTVGLTFLLAFVQVFCILNGFLNTYQMKLRMEYKTKKKSTCENIRANYLDFLFHSSRLNV